MPPKKVRVVVKKAADKKDGDGKVKAVKPAKEESSQEDIDATIKAQQDWLDKYMKFEFNNNELLKKMLGHYGQIPKGNRSKISGKMMSLGAGVVVSDNVTRAIGIFERARRWFQSIATACQVGARGGHAQGCQECQDRGHLPTF